MVLEAATIASALSMDAFVASFAYGSNEIKIPFKSVIIINLVCSVIISISLGLGSLISMLIPDGVQKAVCFLILFLLGLVKLLDSITKSIIKKYGSLGGNLKFSLFNFRFVLNVYADPEKVDVDHSKTINGMEAVSLAIALSLDGAAVGFGAAMGQVNGFAIVIASLITNQIAVMLGDFLGNKVAKRLKFNISWISGALLMLMAFLKL